MGDAGKELALRVLKPAELIIQTFTSEGLAEGLADGLADGRIRLTSTSLIDRFADCDAFVASDENAMSSKRVNGSIPSSA
jgi:hypothetical protein